MDLNDLLKRLDDPDWLVSPRGYNPTAMVESFAALVHGLDVSFETRCATDTEIQDSSEYARVEVPAEATVRETRIIVSISKFGSLAFVAAENPGAFLGTAHAQAEGELDAGDLAKVEQALADSGYVVVPEELLTSRYYGPSHLRKMSPSFPPTWWDRYFGSF
ncbi:hypothetical protein [Catenulispora pinisilvae]|uniref:hypothetical protein n=1 Tax=Catenulispora pinisilvae TaxID=2705253 RepID=UPI001E581799|nr:hypothetical protein [Catenulispora pinisilvae]